MYICVCEHDLLAVSHHQIELVRLPAGVGIVEELREVVELVVRLHPAVVRVEEFRAMG